MNTSVNRGEEVNLSCTYPLEPVNINISWTGPTGANHTMVTSLDETTKSTLLITTVNGSHAGDYFCTAQLSDVRVTSTTATLIVNCKYCMY